MREKTDMDQIYQQYAQMVYRYLFSLTHDSSVSEELTQETFYQAVRSIHRFDGSSRISTWLCGIARNTLLTYRRRNPSHENIEDQVLTASSAESDALQEHDRVELFRKLHRLPDPYRDVLYMRIFGDLSFREIGEILEHTENWARITYYRGKEKLRKEVEKDEKNTL